MMTGLRPRLAILILLVLGGALHADSYTQVCNVSDIGANGGSDFIAIALALVSVAIAAAYMYGKAMEAPEAEVWARDEAANLVITVLLFAGLAAFFTGACNLAVAYTGDSPFAATYNYLDRLAYNQALPGIKHLIDLSLHNQEGATKYLYVGFVPYTGHGIAPDASKRALSANEEFTIDLFLPMIASLEAQRQILQALQIFSSSMLLPFAFILRLIAPTREMGNMMIALFFGIYIVAPTMYALSSAAFDKVMANPMSHMTTCTVARPPLPPLSVPCPIYDFKDWSLGPETGSGSWLFRIGAAMPQAVFLPNLVIIVVTTCAMSMTKALRAIQV